MLFLLQHMSIRERRMEKKAARRHVVKERCLQYGRAVGRQIHGRICLHSGIIHGTRHAWISKQQVPAIVGHSWIWPARADMARVGLKINEPLGFGMKCG